MTGAEAPSGVGFERHGGASDVRELETASHPAPTTAPTNRSMQQGPGEPDMYDEPRLSAAGIAMIATAGPDCFQLAEGMRP